MQAKLPIDIKRMCIAIVQGYDRRVKWYRDERYAILNSSPAGFINYKNASGTDCRQYLPPVSGHISDTPYDKTVMFENLESHIDTKCMRAVDEAKLQIGLDIEDEELRRKLMKAVMLNCMSGKRYPYEYLDVGNIGRSSFYRHRDKFLYKIAHCLQFV